MLAFKVLPLLLPHPSLTIWILTSVRDIAKHQEGSGAELVNPILAKQDTFTICARFVSYQFTFPEKHPWQWYISLGGESLVHSLIATEENSDSKYLSGDNWSNGDVLLSDSFGTNKKVGLKPKNWNSACISFRKGFKNRALNTYINRSWHLNCFLFNARSYETLP